MAANSPGVLRGDDVVVRAVEDEGWLAEVRVVLVECAVIEQGRGQRARAVFAVVKDFDGARVAPCGYGIGAHTFGPAAGESKRGRE